MRCRVQLIVAGQVFNEEVRAVDYQEARQVALARNPNARVISVTAVFLWQGEIIINLFTLPHFPLY